MIIEHLKETLCTGLEPLELGARNCHDNGVELIAIVIGTLVIRLTRSPRRPPRRRRMSWLRPLLRLLRGAGGIHTMTCLRTAGRMLAPALFS